MLNRLGSLLSAPPEKAAEAAERTLSRLAEAERAQQSLMKQLVELEVARMTTAAQDGAICRILDGWPMADLRALVQRLLAGGVTHCGSRQPDSRRREPDPRRKGRRPRPPADPREGARPR